MKPGDRVRLRHCPGHPDCPQVRLLGTLLAQAGGGRRAWYVELEPYSDLCPDGGAAEVRESLMELIPPVAVQPEPRRRRLECVAVGDLGFGTAQRIVYEDGLPPSVS